jgi:hypothetical protein
VEGVDFPRNQGYKVKLVWMHRIWSLVLAAVATQFTVIGVETKIIIGAWILAGPYVLWAWLYGHRVLKAARARP